MVRYTPLSLTAAMMKRGKKSGDDMLSYKVVIGVFVVVCVASVLYVFLNPKKSMKDIPVIDEEAMLLHNSESSFFKVQENEMFKVKTAHMSRSFTLFAHFDIFAELDAR